MRIAAAALLASAPLLAQTPAPPGSDPADAAAPATQSSPQAYARIRVYEGFGTVGPLYDRRGVPPYALDVGVGLTACPDGNTGITEMNIGGWTYRLASTCRFHAAGAGKVEVRRIPGGQAGRDPPQEESEAAQAPSPGLGPPARLIRCNPATWSCSTSTR